jgi:hypothetical protein
MVDYFMSRMMSCEEAAAGMEECESKECSEDMMIQLKKSVLVFCTEPGSPESALGSTGKLQIITTSIDSKAGDGSDDPVSAATSGKEKAIATGPAADLLEAAPKEEAPPSSSKDETGFFFDRRLKDDASAIDILDQCLTKSTASFSVDESVTDGSTSFDVSSLTCSTDKSNLGDLKGVSVSLTGPNKDFELDVDVQLSSFLPGAYPPMPDPTKETNGYWLDAATLWTIGVVPSFKDKVQMAKSPDGGKAITLQTRRLTEKDIKDKRKGIALEDFEMMKMGVAKHVLKLSQAMINEMTDVNGDMHHMHEKKQRAWLSSGAVVGCSVIAALVVLKIGVNLSRQKKGYTAMAVAPEEQDDPERRALGGETECEL